MRVQTLEVEIIAAEAKASINLKSFSEMLLTVPFYVSRVMRTGCAIRQIKKSITGQLR